MVYYINQSHECYGYEYGYGNGWKDVRIQRGAGVATLQRHKGDRGSDHDMMNIYDKV
jgi:hypothetical protein